MGKEISVAASVAIDVAVRVRPLLRQKITMERLLWWAYQDEAVGVGTLDRPDNFNHGGDGYSEGEGSGARCTGGRSNPHPDAVVVASVVDGSASRLGVGLLISHAKAGTRPDWKPEGYRVAVEPIRVDQRGRPRKKPRVEVIGPHRAAFCPVRIEDNRELVDFARERYRLWHGVLTSTAETLQRHAADLARWEVTGTGVDAEPWLDPIKVNWALTLRRY